MTVPGIHELVIDLARAVGRAGGRAFLVGGWVRELERRRLAGSSGQAAAGRAVGQPAAGPPEAGQPGAEEYDLEVYGLAAEALTPILARAGTVRLVGESFAVYKVAPAPRGPDGPPPPSIDVSLPRRDTKVAPGHRGFRVIGDPALSVGDASRRRDFTVNAMLHDPLTGETIDPWGGRRDLEARVLRAVDPATFVEDSLRVLRAMQFAARLEFTVDPATVDLCRGIDLADLPAERIWGEMEKLLLRSAQPSIGLDWAERLRIVDRLFPELKALQGCPQEPEWHPEGDVWIHTLMAVDRAALESAALPKATRLTVMLATLCHDFGKPATTAVVDGRIRSYDHEEAGIEPTRAFLDRLNVHTLGGYDVRGQVVALVGSHLTPSHWFKNRVNVTDGAFRRLARRLEPELLYLVSRADCLGRTGDFSTEAQEWFIGRVRSLGVEREPPRPILLGRHLLEMGFRPGPEMGRVLKAIYEMQLDGRIADLDAARLEARRLAGM